MFSFFRNADTGQRIRDLHAGIQQLAMADPLYAEVWGPLNPRGSFEVQRQHMYVNLTVSQWELEYDLGVLTGEHLREIAEAVFSTAPGRRYWPVSRPLRLTSAKSRRRRRFLAILDEAYAAASPGQPSAAPEPAPAPA